MDAAARLRRPGRWPPVSPGALAWPAFWASVFLTCVGAALLLAGEAPEGDTALGDLLPVSAFPVTPFVGAVLASRRPSNPIGWLFLAAGVCSGVTVFAAGYGEWGVLAHAGSLPAADEVAWLVTLGWFQFAVPATFLLLLFPDGTLVSGRRRPVAWAAGAGVILSWVGFAFEPGPIEGTEFTNPFGLEEAEAAGAVGFPLVFASLVAGFAALVVRFRRGDELRRRQIRLLAYAGGLLATVVVGVNSLGGHVPENPVANAVVELLLFVGLPAAVAVAVLRHRLYEIDRLIRRSVVYGVLWVAITGAYVGVAAGLGIAAGSRLPVWTAVVLTIAVTLVFQPARRRVEALADRWVFGPRKSRYELLTEFGSTLRDAFALDEVTPRLAQTVRAGLDLSWVRVALYLESDQSLQLRTVAADGPAPADGVDPVATVPLAHGGDPLGMIECGPKVEGELSDEDRTLLSTLAVQASVAVRNARLAAELAARLDEIRHQAVELAASRARLVQAQDAERRRKHAAASQARVQLGLVGAKLRVEVADDGIGFDPAAVTGSGLAHLADRVAAVGGTLRVDGAPGGGSVVLAELPPGRGRPPVPEPAPRLRVVIAEDNYIVREGTRRLLEDTGEVEVVATVGTAEELLAAARRLVPDAVIADIRMPPGHAMEGIVAAHAIRATMPAVGVVVLSQHADPAYALELFGRAPPGWPICSRTGWTTLTNWSGRFAR